MQFSKKQLREILKWAKANGARIIEFRPEQRKVLFWYDEMNLLLEEYF